MIGMLAGTLLEFGVCVFVYNLEDSASSEICVVSNNW